MSPLASDEFSALPDYTSGHDKGRGINESRRVAHLSSCDWTRLEAAHYEVGHGPRVTGIRCQSCGAQLVLAEPERRLDPSSAEYAELWESDPARLARSLTPAERLDPDLNPLHPAATWPPARTPTLPSAGVQIDPTLRAQLARRRS